MTELMKYISTIFSYCFYIIIIAEAIATAIFLIIYGKNWACKALYGDDNESFVYRKKFFRVLILAPIFILITIAAYLVILKFCFKV